MTFPKFVAIKKVDSSEWLVESFLWAPLNKVDKPIEMVLFEIGLYREVNGQVERQTVRVPQVHLLAQSGEF